MTVMFTVPRSTKNKQSFNPVTEKKSKINPDNVKKK